MNFRSLFIAITIITLPVLVRGQELFRLTFNGTARFVNARDRLAARRLTAQDLIARCVGTNAYGTNRDFQLVYNAGSDSIQVVNATNGTLMCDVLQFEGGVSNDDGRRLERLAFVFVPEKSNAVGSAILLQRLPTRNDRVSMRGHAQFVLTSLEPGSAPFIAPAPAPNAGTNGVPVTVPPGQPTLPGLPVVPPVTVPNNPILGDTNTPAVPGTPPSVPPVTVPNNPVVGDTNVPGIPGLPAAPGSLANSTNGSNVSGTNVLGLPGLPSVADPSRGGTGETGASATVAVPLLPGTSVNSTVTGAGTGLTTAMTPPSAPTALLPTLSPLGSTNLGQTLVQDAAAEGSLTNVVICSGTFSAGREFTPRTNP
jgi:hypothetical protein